MITFNQRHDTRLIKSAVSALNAFLVVLLTLSLSVGCTVIRDDSGEGEGGGATVIVGGAEFGGVEFGGVEFGGVTGGPQVDESPVNVDLLVLVSLDQSLVSDYYGSLINDVVAHLALSFVFTRKVAIAPMYRRVNAETPLLYGVNDEEQEFDSYQSAMDYFTSAEGLALLEEDGERLDGDNLIELGARLGRTTIYHPSETAQEGRYYYEEPNDGLIVLWINPFKRRCELGGCQLDGGSLAELLTARTSEGEASWLSLGSDKSLPAEKVFHLFMGTEETDNEEAFSEACASQTSFPSRVLDHIEPSPNALYAQLREALDDEGIPSEALDFCEALSSSAPLQHTRISTRVRAALRP